MWKFSFPEIENTVEKEEMVVFTSVMVSIRVHWKLLEVNLANIYEIYRLFINNSCR